MQGKFHSRVKVFALLILAINIVPQAIAAEDSNGRRPNIIVVLADDLGLSRVSCYGAQPFRTPNIDRLAAEGIRFDRCYSMPVCGPSRSALLTGKYPFRTGAVGNGSSIIDSAKNPTIANILQKHGYRTCAIGKLGQSAEADDVDAPRRLGFDESMLWMGRGTPDRYWSPRYFRNGQVTQGTEQQYGPDLTHDFLVDFMDRHRSKPFFVYYSCVLSHAPYVPTPDSLDDQNLVPDMVAYLDKQMGRLVADLERLGLRQNTVILFTSDNGPAGEPLGTVHGVPMLGRKGQPAEGGVREPLIANCPGLVPAAKVCDDLTDFTDFFPTILQLARVERPADLVLDGQSIAPQLLGQPAQPRQWVYAQIEQEYFIANKRFKLYGDGKYVDLKDSPAMESPIAIDDSQAQIAKQQLAAILAKIRSGFETLPSTTKSKE